ncbi:MAG: sn-glycerol-3-phosphate ABC transporter ATP-binding protein UgpC [Bacilli bacterium]
MATVTLKNINKVYDGNVHAVVDFNLHIKDKEFIVFVGPSGCGKTTTLRMVAGLEDITSGELRIDDLVVNDIAPKDRDIAMVFQSYALYPHMTVYDNMAFGLKLRKFSKDEIDRRVNNAAEILGLRALLHRRPKALSGGQRQRVALGRAIVRDAKVFLMDEPLSNLDAKLRVQMRTEIIKITEKLGITTIYVTHDQIEAMTMASRIVVMKDGLVQQIGSPKEIYDFPNNKFVGGFIGTPPMNFLEGQVMEDGFFVCGDHKVGITKLKVPTAKFNMLKEQKYLEKNIIMGIRPEDIHDENVVIETYKDSTVDLKVDVAELLGAETLIYAAVNTQPIVARVNARVDVHMNDDIQLAFDMNKCHFFDMETDLRIKKN